VQATEKWKSKWKTPASENKEWMPKKSSKKNTKNRTQWPTKCRAVQITPKKREKINPDLEPELEPETETETKTEPEPETPIWININIYFPANGKLLGIGKAQSNGQQIVNGLHFNFADRNG